MLCWEWYAFVGDVNATKTLEIVRSKRTLSGMPFQYSPASYQSSLTFLKSIDARWRNIAFSRRQPSSLLRSALPTRIVDSAVQAIRRSLPSQHPICYLGHRTVTPWQQRNIV